MNTKVRNIPSRRVRRTSWADVVQHRNGPADDTFNGGDDSNYAARKDDARE